MKKLLFILSALFSFVSYTSAQSIAKDFFKSQSQIKKDTLLIVDSVSVDSIKSNIFLLRQDYSLYNKRKKKMYGFDDQDYFGKIYSIGLKCAGFNILFDQAVHPWNYDENYKLFANNKLIPQVTTTWYNLINDSTSSGYIHADSVIVPVQQIKENFVYASKAFTQAQQGFEVNNADTCKSGILVWICLSKGNLDSDNVRIQLKQSTVNAEMFGSIPVYPPSDAKNIIGALYLTKSNTNKGIRLSGVVQNKNGKYMLEFPFKNFTYAKQENASIRKVGKLTEIKKK